jgi:putative membrane protein
MSSGEQPMVSRRSLATVAKGFCMGAADVVPGVSGGTMAFILGVYERLLGAIRAFDLSLLGLLAKRDIARAARHVDLPFLLPLGVGIVCAIVVFTKVIPLPSLIHTHPVPVFSLFFGLVAGSIVVLLKQAERFGLAEFALLVLGAILGFTVVNLVPTDTPDASWFIFLCGAVSICAMILPGVSGSFILLMMRKYAYVLDAIGRFDLTVLIPFALGAAFGLALFTRFLLWLINRFRTGTLVTITGLLLGSLWLIWPFQERTYEMVRGKSRLISSTPISPFAAGDALPGAIGVMLLGLAGVFLIEYLARHRGSDNATV